MSQCCQRKRRLKIAPKFLILSVLLIANACTLSELERVATEYETSRPDQSGQSISPLYNKNDILVPEEVIYGGQRPMDGVVGTFSRLLVGPGNEVRFNRPVAVGGVENYLYIVDAGFRVVFRYDLLDKRIKPLGQVGAEFIGEPGNIYVAKDLSFYIVDNMGKQVFHYDEQGQILNTFRDTANLANPIDVWVDEQIGDVYVADGSYSHIVVFNQFGKAYRAVGRRGQGPGRFRAITDLTAGVDGSLYVLDRMELPVQVITKEGVFRYSFGENEQVFPTSIAVDDNQLVFVSDKSDNKIRVYENGQLLAAFGGGGHAPGRFRIITNLWVNGQFLYVADSQNRRVQVMRINSPSAVSIPLGL